MSSPFHKSKIVSERIYMKYTTGKIGKGCKTALFGVNSMRQEDTNVTPTFVYVELNVVVIEIVRVDF